MASYRKLKSGWKVIISKRDSNGQLKQVSKNGFATKNEAKLYAAKIESKRDGVLNQKKRITFSDHFEQWFLLYKKNKVAKTTQNRYKIIHNTINDFFGTTLLSKVTRNDYQKFINSFGATHAKDTVLKTHSIIKSCVQSAIFDELITKDFTQKIELIYNKDKDIIVEYLSVSEIHKLSNYLKRNLDPKYPSKYMILLAIYTGARLGEIQALTWHDIDFEHNTIAINKAWNYHEGGGFKDTKTDTSNRVIKVNKEILDIIKQLKKENTDMVFMSVFKKIPTSNAVNKMLRSALVACDLNKKNFHFHSLRHSHVAYLLYQGIDLYAISKRLGHSDLTTTTKRYAYLIDEHRAQSDQLIEQAINKI
ncbi:site-specific integrase [Ligilactobacillus apodemi]|uniref:site-specific integrase n=1 Tax=Ligilactobacillus apodemi TaxID=307126 RepID=UPI00214B1ED0|nr:site-specific integrase [Ligilactobacillus apodemi]MCR1902273.1 site-specific integrase [Ligilactobacillus apodemi]